MTEESIPASEPREESASDAPESSPFAALSRDVAEIIEYASCYVDATVDRGRLSLKETLWTAVSWICGIVVVSGVLLTSVIFLFFGASLGLAQAFGGRLWLGCLVSGFAFLAATFLLIRWGRYRSRKASLRKKVEDYERTLDEQRDRFGTDLEQKAEAVS